LKDLSFTDENGIQRFIPGDELLEMLTYYLENEELQNEMAMKSNPLLGMKLMSALDYDEMPGSEGEFGLVDTNPIPVNGSLGQQIYLSKLRTTDGSKLLFQRLGSRGNQIGMVDIFEVISFDGKVHTQLFLELYNKRRSRKAPKGFTLADGFSPLTGTHVRVPNFPDGYREYVYDSVHDEIFQRAYEEPAVIERVVKKLLAGE
jgi:hypothetical protein